MNKLQQEIEYFKSALESDPAGLFCGFCGKTNDFVDDCGWFYIESYLFIPPDIYIPDKLKPCCKSCYYGEIGQLHREKYGVGDR